MYIDFYIITVYLNVCTINVFGLLTRGEKLMSRGIFFLQSQITDTFNILVFFIDFYLLK